MKLLNIKLKKSNTRLKTHRLVYSPNAYNSNPLKIFTLPNAIVARKHFTIRKIRCACYHCDLMSKRNPMLSMFERSRSCALTSGGKLSVRKEYACVTCLPFRSLFLAYWFCSHVMRRVPYPACSGGTRQWFGTSLPNSGASCLFQGVRLRRRCANKRFAHRVV